MKRPSMKFLAMVIAVFAITGIAASCGKSDKLDVKGIKELVKKDSKDITSADVDFFIEQVEIATNKTKGMTKEEAKAYFESMGEDEQECVMALGMMTSAALSSRTKLPDAWSDAQLERLKKLAEQSK